MAYMPDLQDKKTTAAKEPVEVSCTGCESKFRLWVPAEMLPEWERGVRISCVRCGSQYFIKKKSTGFEIKPLAAAAQTQAAPAGSPVAPAAVHEAPGMKETKAAQRTPAAVDADKETILVVEDDRLSREMVESTLTELGFRTIPAKNAAEAMTAARKERINLIVTDLYLKNPTDPASDIDGGDLLQKMHDSGVGVPAIITTGKDILDDLVLDPKWFELKVKGFIQKGNPFWVEELKLKVKEVLYKG